MDRINSWKGRYMEVREDDLESTEREHLSNFLKIESVYPTVSTLEGNEGLRTSDKKNIVIRITEIKDKEEKEEKKIEFRTDRLLSILSGESIMTSEDLIINENIDFLYERSEKSNSVNVSPSFSYSRTDNLSSVFQSFYSPNLLMQSLPDSELDVGLDNKKSCDTQEPRFPVERYDLEMLKNGWVENRVKSKFENDIIMQKIKAYMEGESFKDAEGNLLFEISEKLGVERKKECGCGGCSGCSGCSII